MKPIFHCKKQSLIFFALFIAIFSINTFAQGISVKIKIISDNLISIEGSFNDESKSFVSWSFLQSYADVSNLAEKIENLQLFDDKGNKIEIKKFNAGEYLANQKPFSFAYQVNLAPSAKLTDAAHTSWLTANQGLLMLGDLLPQMGSENVLVNFDLPKDFRIAHQYPRLEKIVSLDNVGNKSIVTEKTDQFGVFDWENAVFLVGKEWRQKEIKFSGKNQISSVNLILSGIWQFSDEEAVEMAKSIIEEYQNTFEQLPLPFNQIILLPFPIENRNPDRWRAETRGSTVTIISGSLPYKSQAIQRLHEQLRHEIFHLWLPNGINLTGNYDWFYEGFTIYQALRTGLQLNQIRFEDFLNTLGKSYDLSAGQSISLIEASNKRWMGTANFIYARGLLIAFLCDVALLQASKGKRSLKDVFRLIYQNHRIPNPTKDGNSAILTILKGFPELNKLIQDYIEGETKLHWENDLAAIGVEPEINDFGVQLKVLANLNKRQKDLLDKLGYNQWRKFLQKTK